MEVSGGKLLLDLFQGYGIEYIFCSPGTEWVSVWEEIIRRSSQGEQTLKYINCRHEILAVSMAVGYAQATGRLPAVLLHANVGPLQAAMAIRTAYQTRVPMIVCGSDTTYHLSDRNIKLPGGYWINQLSDMGGPDAIVRPFVKWSNSVRSRETLIDSVNRGCQIARTYPQGPVFLSISRELMLMSMQETKIVQPSSTTALPEPRPDDLAEVADLLLQSTKPVIITEHAGEKPEAVDKLIELSELLCIPVFQSTQPLYANFPRNHPLHMGYDASEALQEADTVFVVGSATPWYPPLDFPKNDATVIVLDKDPLQERLPYWGYQSNLLLSADIGDWLTALVETIRTRTPEMIRSGPQYQKRFERWRSKHDQMVEQWRKEAFSGQGQKPISPTWFLFMLQKMLPENAIIVEETITHSILVHRYLSEPNRYIRACSGGLGSGLGIAAGTKVACKDKPVIFLVGDGTFNYSPVLAGLGFCQEYQLPVMVIILNNSSYRSMKKMGYQSYYPEGWAVSQNTYLGVDITPNPDYFKVAEAFGAHGETLEEPDDIESALNRALQQISIGRTALLDVRLA